MIILIMGSSNDNSDLISKIKKISKIRKSISLELKTIAKQTKISTNTLKNIEELKFDKLPPHPIKESFIMQYFSEVESRQEKKIS